MTNVSQAFPYERKLLTHLNHKINEKHQVWIFFCQMDEITSTLNTLS